MGKWHGGGWDARRAYPHTCAGCGETFLAKGRYTRWCSDTCRLRKPPVVHAERPCERCQEPFVPTRSDARFCSGRCRVAAHRAR